MHLKTLNLFLNLHFVDFHVGRLSSCLFFFVNEETKWNRTKNPCVLLLFTVDYVHICPGEWLTITGSGGVSISSDPEVNPQEFLVFFFSSTADDLFLSQQNKMRKKSSNAMQRTAPQQARLYRSTRRHARAHTLQQPCTTVHEDAHGDAPLEPQRQNDKIKINCEQGNNHPCCIDQSTPPVGTRAHAACGSAWRYSHIRSVSKTLEKPRRPYRQYGWAYVVRIKAHDGPRAHSSLVCLRTMFGSD